MSILLKFLIETSNKFQPSTNSMKRSTGNGLLSVQSYNCQILENINCLLHGVISNTS